jgi:amino acid transporter
LPYAPASNRRTPAAISLPKSKSVSSLSNSEIERARDYALAEAAKPFLGELGFRLIAIAALFSTASAINATLFGSANVCYMIARDGELPPPFRELNGNRRLAAFCSLRRSSWW